MCGRTAVSRRGARLAHLAGARRIVRPSLGAKQSQAAGAGKKQAKGKAPAAAAASTSTPATDALLLYSDAQTPSSFSEQNHNVAPTRHMPVLRWLSAEERQQIAVGKKAKVSVEDVQSAREEEEKATDESGELVLHFMQFGIEQTFGGRKRLLINARGEGMEQKPFWKRFLGKKRCAVMVDGFFEWHTERKASGETYKQPYFFHMPAKGKQEKAEKDEPAFPPMYLAGIYDCVYNKETEESAYQLCIITVGPSAQMKPIHGRMPVVLTEAEAREWIDVENNSIQKVKKLLRPYEGLVCYKVSTVVNALREHGPVCIQPIEDVEEGAEGGTEELKRQEEPEPPEHPEHFDRTPSPTPSMAEEEEEEEEEEEQEEGEKKPGRPAKGKRGKGKAAAATSSARSPAKKRKETSKVEAEEEERKSAVKEEKEEAPEPASKRPKRAAASRKKQYA